MSRKGAIPRPRVTQADVARAAAVSRTTASFVLTGRRDMRISPEVEARVRRVAAELGYRPNLASRSLRSSRTQTIGLLSDVIATSPFAGELIHGGLDAALRHDHLLLVAESEGDPAVGVRLYEEMVDRRVDGLVFATMVTREVALPDHALDHPLVLLNCYVADRSVPSLVPDEREAGRTAARALLEAGHRDGIVLLGEPAFDVFAGRERVAGIIAELAVRGSRLEANLTCRWHSQDAYATLLAALDEGPAPRAVICLNDRVALGAYQALSARGLSIPDDVSVVSFDDSELAAWLVPALTTVALPHYAMGYRAVELLTERRLDRGRLRVPMPLRARGSVGPPMH